MHGHIGPARKLTLYTTSPTQIVALTYRFGTWDHPSDTPFEFEPVGLAVDGTDLLFLTVDPPLIHRVPQAQALGTQPQAGQQSDTVGTPDAVAVAGNTIWTLDSTTRVLRAHMDSGLRVELRDTGLPVEVDSPVGLSAADDTLYTFNQGTNKVLGMALGDIGLGPRDSTRDIDLEEGTVVAGVTIQGLLAGMVFIDDTLYVSTRGEAHDNIYEFTVEADGSLSNGSRFYNVPSPASNEPRGMAATDTTLYVINDKKKEEVWVFDRITKAKTEIALPEDMENPSGLFFKGGLMWVSEDKTTETPTLWGLSPDTGEVVSRINLQDWTSRAGITGIWSDGDVWWVLGEGALASVFAYDSDGRRLKVFDVHGTTSSAQRTVAGTGSHLFVGVGHPNRILVWEIETSLEVTKTIPLTEAVPDARDLLVTPNGLWILTELKLLYFQVGGTRDERLDLWLTPGNDDPGAVDRSNLHIYVTGRTNSRAYAYLPIAGWNLLTSLVFGPSHGRARDITGTDTHLYVSAVADPPRAVAYALDPLAADPPADIRLSPDHTTPGGLSISADWLDVVQGVDQGGSLVGLIDGTAYIELGIWRVQLSTDTAPMEVPVGAYFEFDPPLYVIPPGWLILEPEQGAGLSVYRAVALADDRAGNRWTAEADSWSMPSPVVNRQDVTLIFVWSADQPEMYPPSADIPSDAATIIQNAQRQPDSSGRIWKALGVKAIGASVYTWGEFTAVTQSGDMEQADLELRRYPARAGLPWSERGVPIPQVIDPAELWVHKQLDETLHLWITSRRPAGVVVLSTDVTVPGRTRVARSSTYFEQANTAPSTRGGGHDAHGIFNLVAINSPVTGRHLVGLIGDYYLFHIPLDESVADPLPSSVLFQTTIDDPLAPARTLPMATDERFVMFIVGRELRLYDLVLGELLDRLPAPTPADQNALLPDENWVDVAWIDGYFIAATKGGQWYHSQLYESAFDQLDFTFASANPDGLVGLATYQRRLFLLGQRSIERWFNSGGGDFAFERDRSIVEEIGCLARVTIQVLPEGIFFVGSDRIVYILTEGLDRISTDAVEERMRDADPDALTGSSYIEDGHRFYVLSFADEAHDYWTWVFDVRTRLWHERSIEAVSAIVDMPGARKAANLLAQRGQDVLLTLSREHFVESVTRQMRADDVGVYPTRLVGLTGTDAGVLWGVDVEEQVARGFPTNDSPALEPVPIRQAAGIVDAAWRAPSGLYLLAPDSREIGTISLMAGTAAPAPVPAPADVLVALSVAGSTLCVLSQTAVHLVNLESGVSTGVVALPATVTRVKHLWAAPSQIRMGMIGLAVLEEPGPAARLWVATVAPNATIGVGWVGVVAPLRAQAVWAPPELAYWYVAMPYGVIERWDADLTRTGTTEQEVKRGLYGEVITAPVHANRAFMQHTSFEVDVPYRSGGAAEDNLRLDWSENAGQSFVGKRKQLLGLRRDPDRPVPERFKFYQIGGTDRQRHYRIRMDAERPWELIGGYLEIGESED